MTFKKKTASRALRKVRILLTGVSGSGKSLGGLYLAKGLLETGKKLVVIDTESGSANEYEGLMPYEVIQFDPPYTPERYIEAMEYAVRETPDIGILMVDSISHEWKLMLEQKDAFVNDNPGCNQWTAWGPFTKRHDAFLDRLLHLPCHVFCTARSKTKYVIGEKNRPHKVGVNPIIREETDFDFNPEFDFSRDTHKFTVKSRSGEFKDDMGFSKLDWNSCGDILNERHGRLLYDHLFASSEGRVSRSSMKDNLARMMDSKGLKAAWAVYVAQRGDVKAKSPSKLPDDEYGVFVDWCANSYKPSTGTDAFGDGTTTNPTDIPDAAEQEQIRLAEIKESEGK